MLENTEGAIKKENPEKLATPYVASFSGFSFFDCPFGIL
jgi:hypothetical protein